MTGDVLPQLVCASANPDKVAEIRAILAGVVDLLSIAPMDTETLAASVAKTGRCVIVHEGPRTCGIAAEIIARINEHAFEYLCAPIKRVTGYDIHFPYFQVEQHYLPDVDTIIDGAKELMTWE